MDFQNKYETMLQSAQTALENSDFQLAEEIFEAMIREQPGDVEALNGLAQIAFTQKEFNKSLNYLKKILIEDPHNFDIAQNIFVVVSESGDSPQETIQSFWDQIATSTALPLLLITLFMEEEDGDLEEANLVYRQMLKIPIQEDRARVNRAIAQLFMGDNQDAVETLQNAIEVAEDPAYILFNLAMLYSSINQYDAALRSIEKLLDKNPNYLDAIYQRGLIYQELGQFEEAEIEIRRLIEIMPEADEFYFVLGDLFLQQAKFENALTVFENLLADDQQIYSAHFGIALALKGLGQYASSLDHYQEMIKLDL